ncbi:MAG TPA: FlgD immunoglobulin-like domain containing protein [Gaiellaceae bacterium]|nr:FlgD immunoglobulin-like domain containing protein [Gaiellaceae bacterium]
MLRSLAVGLAALALPGVAHAGLVSMRVVPQDGRSLQAAQPAHFNMLAAQWHGPGSVAYRVHRHRGWSSWRPAPSDDPDWTGAADRVQFRTIGTVAHLRAFELWSRTSKAPARALSSASSPPIVLRTQWEADEKIVRAKPLIAKTLKLALVHHTAGTNNYTEAESAAIVRGIELYHVQGNGWNDIGYNFLVDRFGTIYEGRAGGITRAVIGAHSEGFNTGTVGISLIGNFQAAAPSPAMQDALVKLLAWRLDVAHIDPLSTVAYTSGGNAKYKAGKVVTLNAISGHRDTYFTECPGTGAYKLLPAIAKRVAATGLPKIYGPTVTGVLGGPVRFQARLSAKAAWTVTVSDAKGAAVAHGSGSGTAVDWTWQAPAKKAGYTWTISAPHALSASGTIGAGATPPPPPPVSAFALTAVSMTPAVLVPAADGTFSPATVSFTTSGPAHVTAQILDATQAVVATPFDQQLPAGPGTFAVDPSALPDGRYTLSLVATPATGAAATAQLPFAVDRTLSAVSVTTGADDTTALSFTLSQAVAVHVAVQPAKGAPVTLFDGPLGTGSHTLAWDGTDGAGNPLPPGAYTLVLVITDAGGKVEVPLQVEIAA